MKEVKELLVHAVLFIFILSAATSAYSPVVVITPNSTNPSGGGWSDCNSPTSGGWSKCFCAYTIPYSTSCTGTPPTAWSIDFTDKADLYLEANNTFYGNVATGFWPDAYPFGVEYPLDKLDNLYLDVDINIPQASYSGGNVYPDNFSRYAIVMAVDRTNGPTTDGYSLFYTELDFWDSNTAPLGGKPHYVASNFNATNPFDSDSMQGGGDVCAYKIYDWENKPLNQWQHFHFDFLPFINSTLKFSSCPQSDTERCYNTYDKLQNGTGIHAGDKLKMIYVAIESIRSGTKLEALVANFSVTANSYCYILSKTITDAFSGVYDPVADVNKDCVVDTHDLTAWGHNSDNESWCYQKLNDNTPCSTTLTQSATPASGTAPAPVTPTFICKYTGSTGAAIAGATVNVTIDSNVYAATYNPSTGDYRYSGVSLSGGHQWYCSASKTGYSPQTATSSWYHTLPPPGCDLVIDPGSTIDQSNKVYCLDVDIQCPHNPEGCVIFPEPLPGNTLENTTLDCRGFAIHNKNPSSSAYGIFLKGYNNDIRNIMIKNCKLDNFGYGIYATSESGQGISNITLMNNTVYNGGYIGFSVGGSRFTTLINNTAYNNSVTGFYVDYYSSDINLIHNTAYNNTWHGFFVNGYNITLAGNTAYNNGNGHFNYDSYSVASGFNINGCSNYTLTNNTAYNNNPVGFFLFGVGMDKIQSSVTNNTANNNLYMGFFLEGSYNINLTNNTASSNSYGFDINSSVATFINNTANSNSIQNFYFDSSYITPPMPVAALKGGPDGQLYIPDASKLDPSGSTTIGYLKVDLWCNMSDTDCVTNSGVTVCGCNRSVGDQAGGVSPYPTIASWPDRKVDIRDTAFIAKKYGTIEGETTPTQWDYLADVVLDKKVDIKDISRTAKNSGQAGLTYSSDLSYIWVRFNNGAMSYPDEKGFIPIPAGAVNFTVYNVTKPVMALVTFYTAPAGSLAATTTKQPTVMIEPTVQMPIGDTWTVAVVLTTMAGLIIGYLILRQALYTGATRKRKKK